MKSIFKLYAVSFIILLFSACATNPLSGKKTMALVSDNEILSMSFSQYDTFLKENTVIKGTPEAEMVTRVGSRIAQAAQVWLERENALHYLDGYEWEFNLVQDNSINAWCMPGGKIVVYTGILPVAQTEEGLAVVMGHEVAHALLNHGQQRMSAGVLQQLGAAGVSILFSGSSEGAQSLIMAAYGIGSNVLGTLPFSREHESEADHYGLILMSIAGYNPDAAAPFWERMASLGGGSTPEILSTHPSDATRIKNLTNAAPEAKRIAETFGVKF
jgi:predicted Zn-dependent protease